jgi:hypothetical protein
MLFQRGALTDNAELARINALRRNLKLHDPASSRRKTNSLSTTNTMQTVWPT